MFDYHVHCDFSVDAEGPAIEFAREALKAGLKEICFTTHCDLDPHRRHHDGRVRVDGDIVDVTSDWLGPYVEEVREVSDSLKGNGLVVRCGLEIGFTPGIEGLIEPVIGAFDLDFVLGGVHTLDGVDIVSARESDDYFSRKSPREVCEAYYHDLGEAIRSGLFDCIAHLDIYKRCGLDFYGEPLNVAHMGLAEPLLEEMARRGLCLERNSGGLRKGLKWPYPSPDILRAAKDLGVTGITVGSDAHRPDQVGYGLEACLESAGDAGYDRVVVFERRSRREVPITQANGW
jgi:histidinol-phosphatase (PHP family)